MSAPKHMPPYGNYFGYDGTVPFTFQESSVYNGMFSPSTVHSSNTGLVKYFTHYLFQELMSVFEWEGMPDDWEPDFFRMCLYSIGYIAVFKTPRFGVIFQPCSLAGWGLYYQPTRAIIANPLLKGLKNLKIGRDCEIIKMTPQYTGVMDIITYYADLMAVASETAGFNLFNSRFSYVFGAENQAQANSYKKMMDNISKGDPAVFIDKKLYQDKETGNPRWSMFSQNVGQNYIADRVLLDLRKIRQMFLTDIGIPSANTEKKERLITDEVEANSVETRSKGELWLETMRRGIDKANARYGINLSVEWRFDEVQDIANADKQGEL